ncbi:TPA: hypothetical protein N0F65_001130 [Lagenidium giganteum]|uniref:Uncharacterized protein n=1 Tax=Lagenidium giganteum TaxID=4803 RepID=A0AAV2Z128_9STRA|nr:TPA: hypothetical protein N0F65_001130 [Lagenidium giganteum]
MILKLVPTMLLNIKPSLTACVRPYPMRLARSPSMGTASYSLRNYNEPRGPRQPDSDLRIGTSCSFSNVTPPSHCSTNADRTTLPQMRWPI